MKNITKIYWIIVASFIFINGVNASFMYEKIESVCSITWITFTSSSAWKSDTSSWEIPVAYSWECKKTPELSQKIKEKIYKISSKYFSKYAEKNNWIMQDSSWIALNSEWKKVVKNKLFPIIKKIIAKEIKKENPNFKKIAVLNYFVKTIWYDYYISIPDRIY